MKIDVYLTNNFDDNQTQFQNSLVLLIDVLRASTTICSAIFNGAKEILPCENIEKAMQLYSNLSKDIRLLAGEVDGMKLEGFDLGNSPLEYKSEIVEGKSIVFTSTNGSLTFLKAKYAKLKIITCFSNLNTVLNFLYSQNIYDDFSSINIICSGNKGKFSYEDTTCAGAYVHFLSKKFENLELTDSALMAKNLYNLHSFELKSFLKTRDHSKYLASINMADDLDVAFNIDIFPVIPIVSGQVIKKFSEENN